ncbi:MAG TPA: glycosyltransferase [Rugosimonospora sp.]|jgi:glycosyltransferase involved in cell wall biosynthesis
MRIAMVHSSFAIRGGAERYVRDLSRDLVARGHTVRVLHRGPGTGDPDDHLVRARLSARVPALRKLFTHLGDLVDPTGLSVGDLVDFRPDVVHVHNWQGIGVLPVARLARRYPTCHTVHDYAICDPNNALAHIGRGRPVDRLLGLRSAWLARQLRDVTLLWPAERTRDIVHAHAPQASRLTGRIVPLAVPVPEARWYPGRRDVFLYLGALAPHKGIGILLDAWRAVADETTATLLIAGDGPGRDEVEAAARGCPSIRYLGYLDEGGRVRAMRDAGWLVFPSQWPENFPLSCVEALVAGRPVITSDVARPPMASDASLVGFADRAALVDALRRCAGISAERYRDMSASAAADGRRLDWGAHVAEVVRTYEALAATKVSEVGAA